MKYYFIIGLIFLLSCDSSKRAEKLFNRAIVKNENAVAQKIEQIYKLKNNAVNIDSINRKKMDSIIQMINSANSQFEYIIDSKIKDSVISVEDLKDIMNTYKTHVFNINKTIKNLPRITDTIYLTNNLETMLLQRKCKEYEDESKEVKNKYISTLKNGYWLMLLLLISIIINFIKFKK